METPASRLRGQLTEHLQSHHDAEGVNRELCAAVGSRQLRESAYEVRINGGGGLSVRDLCNILTVTKLERVARRFGWRP